MRDVAIAFACATGAATVDGPVPLRVEMHQAEERRPKIVAPRQRDERHRSHEGYEGSDQGLAAEELRITLRRYAMLASIDTIEHYGPGKEDEDGKCVH
jgi:hypothetical protein